MLLLLGLHDRSLGCLHGPRGGPLPRRCLLQTQEEAITSGDLQKNTIWSQVIYQQRRREKVHRGDLGGQVLWQGRCCGRPRGLLPYDPLRDPLR